MLTHAYGIAVDVPPLLADLTPDPAANVWGELWSRICHQGAVYSASFAALPILADIAAKWKPADRCQILVLAASILASEDVHGCRDDLLRPVEAVVPRFRELCQESLALPKGPQEDFIYLLQAGRSFDGDRFWGLQFDHLVSGEFSGTCPHCSVDLYLVIGKYGFFTTAEEWFDRPATPRTRIVPNHGVMEYAGQWMWKQAQSSQQYEVAEWIRCVFGSTTCPSCDETFEVPVAIAARRTHGLDSQ